MEQRLGTMMETNLDTADWSGRSVNKQSGFGYDATDGGLSNAFIVSGLIQRYVVNFQVAFVVRTDVMSRFQSIVKINGQIEAQCDSVVFPDVGQIEDTFGFG